jgi:hypothetical protein
MQLSFQNVQNFWVLFGHKVMLGVDYFAHRRILQWTRLKARLECCRAENEATRNWIRVNLEEFLAME